MAYTELYQTPCQIGDCPLRASCSFLGPRLVKPSMDDSGQIDVMIVGDACSGSEDFISRNPFGGAEGKLIDSVLEPLKESKSFAFTYLAKGWSVDWSSMPEHIKAKGLVNSASTLYRVKSASLGSRKDKRVIFQKCGGFFQREIEWLRPKQIIVLGNNALEAMFPNESRKITKLRDETLLYRGIPTRFVSSPQSVMRSPSAKPGWVTAFRSAITGEKIERDNEISPTHLVKSLPEALELIEMLENTPGDIAVDFETENLNKRYGNRIGTLQFADSGNCGYVIPYAHPESPFSPDELKILKEALRKLFAVPSQIKHWIGHGLKFESNILQSIIGTPLISAPLFDTQAGAFLLDENRMDRVAEFKYGIYSLKQLALDYLNFDGYDKGVLATREEGKLFDLPMDQLAPYGSMDVWINYRLRDAQVEEAVRQNYYDQFILLIYHYYSDLITLFSDIEFNGSPVNLPHLRNLLSKKSPLLMRINEIEANSKIDPLVQQANALILRDQAGGNKVTPLGGLPWAFNYGKTGHPQKLFFDLMRLPPRGPAGTSGLHSVDEEWRESIKARKVRQVEEYDEWVLMKKMYDSFATKLYAYVDPTGTHRDCNTDCRVRPEYSLSTVVTGRVACKNPNLQAIPRAENDAKRAIKDIFQAERGRAIVQLDYKANEVRWVGILAQDYKLAESFRIGKQYIDQYRLTPTPELLKLAEMYGDVHKVNSALLFGKPLDQITKLDRQKGKALVLALIYDKSDLVLAEELGCEVEEAKALKDKFFEQFGSLLEWKLRTKDFAKRNGYVEAPHGRRRRFPIFDLFRDSSGYFDQRRVPSEYRMTVEEALRQATNSPVQGIASDAGMLGAVFVNDFIRKNRVDWKIQNAVHDSMVINAPIDEVPDLLKVAEHCATTQVKEYFETVWNMSMIIWPEVEDELGLEWGGLKKWNGSQPELDEMMNELRSKDAEKWCA